MRLEHTSVRCARKSFACFAGARLNANDPAGQERVSEKSLHAYSAVLDACNPPPFTYGLRKKLGRNAAFGSSIEGGQLVIEGGGQPVMLVVRVGGRRRRTGA